MLNKRVLSFAILTTSLCSNIAFAGDTTSTDAAGAGQPSAQPPTAAADSSSLQEIIVTAQKRSERLRDVPMSVTAVTGSQLQDQGVTSPADLAKVVPGFTFTESSYGAPVYTLRGIGTYD
jgi:outer membrane receptor protein involved in Fe transport